jgi:hypothetical protein
MNVNKLISTLKTLKLYDFAQIQVDEPMIPALYRCEFMEDAQNALLVGGPSTGKLTLPRPSAYARSNITATAFVFYRR